MEKRIPILHTMARSGGTLISKCIGCMDSVVLLSEVHPFVAFDPFNPLKQAKEWFDFNLSERIREKVKEGTLSWLDGIEVIWEHAEERGLSLVVRDWSHLDYTGIPWVEPGYQLTSAKVLEQRFNLLQLAIVRHPVDQWMSLSKLGLIAGKLTVRDFLKGYREFALAAVKTGFIRYEDFTKEPEVKAATICESLAVPYDSSFVKKWQSYTQITGDTLKDSASRAVGFKKIKFLSRPPVDLKLIQEFEDSEDYLPSINLLGYDKVVQTEK